MVTIHCGSRTFHNIAAILFDKDGTLSNSHNYLVQVGWKRWQFLEPRIADRAPTNFEHQLFQAWGLRDIALTADPTANAWVDPAAMLAVASRRENEIVTAGLIAGLGFDWIEAMAIVQSSFVEASASFTNKQSLTPVFPGIAELLAQLQSAGLKLGILSADVLPNIHSFVELYGLNPYFAAYQGAVEGLSKPNPKLFKLACEALGVDPAHTLMIGDSRADIELAKQAGAAGAIGVHWGWPQAFTLAHADVMVGEITAIRVNPHRAT
jgi:phosphoglycolate phosphatase